MAFTRAGKMEARPVISDFQSESFKSRLQEVQAFDNSVSYLGVNGNFEESDSLNEAEEFVFQTRGPNPRGVIFLHYDARDANTQVEEHFSKSLYLPRIYNVPSEEEFKNSDPTPVPMSQRNFPASFWNPLASKMSPLCCQRTSTVIHAPYMPRDTVLRHAMDTTETCRTSRIQNLPNKSNRFTPCNPRPSSVGTSTSAGPSAPVQSRIPAQNSAGTSGSHTSRFNPQYNQLLVHPDFRAYLPLVPGQSTESHEKGPSSEGERFSS